jgi:hypothetical protein
VDVHAKISAPLSQVRTRHSPEVHSALELQSWTRLFGPMQLSRQLALNARSVPSNRSAQQTVGGPQSAASSQSIFMFGP